MTLLETLETHYAHYPNMELQDFYKLVFQHTFGPEHAICNDNESYHKLEVELQCMKHKQKERFEDIGNHYIRYHLNPNDELPITIINKMFLYGAQHKDISNIEYDKNIQVLKAFFHKHYLPFAPIEDKDTFMPISHSDTYKNMYHPHYRVLDKQFQTYYPLFLEIARRIHHDKKVILTIDGMCGSGKTTLAHMLSFVFDASIIHMDDFFLQPYQRSEERLQEIGGYFDYERFEKDVIMELVPCHDFPYQPYDCHKGQLLDAITIQRDSPILIIEGVYAQHPRLQYENQISVFLEISDKEQQFRIQSRSPEVYSRFMNEWIPREKEYFETFQIKKKAEICIYNYDHEQGEDQ